MADCSQNNHTDELLNTDMNDIICIVGDATFSNRRNIVIFHHLRGLSFINNAAKMSNRGILRTIYAKSKLLLFYLQLLKSKFCFTRMEPMVLMSCCEHW